jgi:hypothetical protein
MPPVADAETEDRLGPFSISGNEYTVVLREKECVPGSNGHGNDLDLGMSVVAMEIRDAKGVVLYQRAFPYRPGGEDGSVAWRVWVSTLSGTSGSGLLVAYSYESEPSAPTQEYPDWWQVFGVVEGKLKAFGAPIYTELVGGSDTARSGAPVGLGSDELQFKVWTGHFRIVFPVRVDWAQGKLTPVQPCEPSATGGAEACQYKVLPEDLRREDDRTFVSLCSSPAEGCQQPERVVVRDDSKVDLLIAQVKATWNAGVAALPSTTPGQDANAMGDAGGITLGPADGLWLKVRIDGKEGWMHGEEDFNVLGLPQDQ